MKQKRIGVFVCWCGLNIASTVDVARVVEGIKSYPNVAYAVHYQYMCSDPGQKMIKDAIREHKLDGFIVAACTHTLHENTYRKLAVSAGLNPYNFECANIREHCSWVHTNIEQATKKSVRIIKSIVDKLALNIELYAVKIPVTEKVLIIGGGITGMQTAIDIASAGHEVIVLDRKSSVGGRMSQLSETFPTLDCTQCIMTPKMVEVGQSPKIRLMMYSEVEDVTGFVGNFNVKIRHKPTYVDWTKCTGCGECERYCRTKYLTQPQQKTDWSVRLNVDERKIADDIINVYNSNKMHLISILHDLQTHYNYLPKPALGYVAQKLDIPLSRVFHVATFYTAFSLEPRGRHHVKVCTGTACHVRGSPRILDVITRLLNIKPGQTSADGEFSLETVNCLGACAMGPVVVIDGEYHQTPAEKVESLLDNIRGVSAKPESPEPELKPKGVSVHPQLEVKQ
jgi:NADH:ubiquinone oxidoreductase subunit E/NAD-dependent dihydropyrimidine dehydrogenase PreA subunit